MQCYFIARRALAFALLAGLFLGASAYAQSAVDGAIAGTIEDTVGAVIPNATVLVHNNGTNSDQSVTTDSSGYFRVSHLQSGQYTVTVTAPGFGAFQSKKVSVR
jgi:carboxypeptidase family protein